MHLPSPDRPLVPPRPPQPPESPLRASRSHCLGSRAGVIVSRSGTKYPLQGNSSLRSMHGQCPPPQKWSWQWHAYSCSGECACRTALDASKKEPRTGWWQEWCLVICCGGDPTLRGPITTASALTLHTDVCARL